MIPVQFTFAIVVDLSQYVLRKTLWNLKRRRNIRPGIVPAPEFIDPDWKADFQSLHRS